MKIITLFASDETGATAIEYGLTAALVSVAIVASLQAVGNGLIATFTAVSSNLTSAK